MLQSCINQKSSRTIKIIRLLVLGVFFRTFAEENKSFDIELNMKIFVHLILNADLIHQGHWYDDDYDFRLWIQYDLYSDINFTISPAITEIINKELEIASKKEWKKYIVYANGPKCIPADSPILFHSSTSSGGLMREEIDIESSNIICHLLNNKEREISVCSNVPNKEDMNYTHGIIGWNNMKYATRYLPQKSECPYRIYRKIFKYETID